MTSVATVIAVFALVLVIGLVLRRRSERQLATLDEADEPDLAALADPSRWPAPPMTLDDEGDGGDGGDGGDPRS